MAWLHVCYNCFNCEKLIAGAETRRKRHEHQQLECVPRLPLLEELSSCSKAPLLFDRMFFHDGPEEEEEDEGFFTAHSLKR